MGGLKIASRVYTEECIIESEEGVFKRMQGTQGNPFWLERAVIEGEYNWQIVTLQIGTELEMKFKKKMRKLIEEN